MSYKIILDSNDTGSYTGNQYDANYQINMNELVRDVKDLDKSYELTFQINSISSSNSGFSRGVVYAVYIDMEKNTSIYRYNCSKHRFSGLLNFEYDYLSYSSVTSGANTSYVTPMLIATRPEDNLPVVYKNLRNINSIRFKVVNTYDNSTFLATTDANARYVCILNLKEVPSQKL